MNVSIDPKTLINGLKIAGLVQQLSLPVKFSASNGEVVFTGTSRTGGNAAIEATFECDVQDPGLVQLPADRLKTLADNTKKGTPIGLEAKNGGLVVTIGKTKGKLFCEAPEAFPSGLWSSRYGEVNTRLIFESPTPLKALIKKATKILGVGDDNTPIPFSGMLQLQIVPDFGVIGRATDGRRLVQASYEFDHGIKEPSVEHIPGPAVGTIAKIANATESPVTLSFTDTFVSASTENIRFASGLSTQTMPDVSRVMSLPDPFYQVKVDASELRLELAKLSAVSETSQTAFPYVDVKFVDNELRLRTKGPNKGYMVGSVSCDYAGPELLMRFTLQHLMESIIDTETVTLSIKDPNPQPFHMIVNHDDCPYKTKHVLMPQAIT